MLPILVRDQRFSTRYRPGDAESGVAPQQAAIVLRRIIGAHSINHLGVGFERAITVSKPFGYEDLVALRGTQHHRDMPAETGGTPANIDRDIEDRARGHAQQLGLGKRRNLEVEAANHALARGQRMVVLDEVGVDSMSLQHVLLEYFRKEPAGID